MRHLAALTAIVLLTWSPLAEAQVDVNDYILNLSAAALADGVTGVADVPHTDEWQFLSQSVVAFNDNDNSGGISAGDTFLDFIAVRVRNLTSASGADLTPVLYGSGDPVVIPGVGTFARNHEITVLAVLEGTQETDLSYRIDAIRRFDFYFDAGSGPAATDYKPSNFQNLDTFDDGVRVESATLLAGGGVNRDPLLPNGTISLVLQLNDELTAQVGEQFELQANGQPFVPGTVLGVVDANNLVDPYVNLEEFTRKFGFSAADFSFVLKTGSDGSFNKVYQPLSPASLGDFVWNDLDRDGVQDADEPGVANVVVNLYDCQDNLLATTTTDSGGFYLFGNLVPGDYKVKFSAPDGFAFTMLDQGSDDALDSDANPATGFTACTSLEAGENDLTWDAGIVVQLAEIGDKVWLDANENGVQDTGEAGVGGVTVELYTCDGGVLVATTKTDTSGLYLFSSLTPGGYYVKFVAPDGYDFTTLNVGDDALDSDADTATGMTACTTLVAGESDLTWDAGLVPEPTDDGGIYPTGTTCQQVRDGTIAALGALEYGVNSKGKIAQDVTPGAFFYFSTFTTASEANHVISMLQVSDPSGYEFKAKTNQVQLFNASCEVLGSVGISADDGTVTITTTAPLPAGTYFTRVGYDSKSIAGLPDPGGLVTYVFSTYVDGSPEAQANDFVLRSK